MEVKEVNDCEHLDDEGYCHEFNRLDTNCTNACPLYKKEKS